MPIRIIVVSFERIGPSQWCARHQLSRNQGDAIPIDWVGTIFCREDASSAWRGGNSYLGRTGGYATPQPLGCEASPPSAGGRPERTCHSRDGKMPRPPLPPTHLRRATKSASRHRPIGWQARKLADATGVHATTGAEKPSTDLPRPWRGVEALGKGRRRDRARRGIPYPQAALTPYCFALAAKAA